MSEVEVNINPGVYLPKYRHLVNSTADINFLYGGRDSGKSHFIAQRLIRDCLKMPYFRCLLIKKTYNSIKESQWQTIKDIVDQWGLNDLFQFKINPLIIECVNGNKFIARGCDDPQSIKSVKDPSTSWYEEGNQLTMDDFITVTTTLRSNRAKIQQWFSFNPECEGDFDDFWLQKTFFKDKPQEGSFDWKLKLGDEEVKYTYTTTHSTYHDNKYCTSERKVFLEQLSEIDPYYYQVYTLGQWGRRANNSPFFFAFDRQKHIKPTVYENKYETIAGFDFNRSPMSCQVWQNGSGSLRCIEAIKLENSDIYAMCRYLMDHYPNALWIVTGDATGRASSALVQDNLNYYKVIKAQMNLGQGQLKVPTVNPPVSENRVLCNAVLQKIIVEIDPVRCKPLIFDLENVRVMADGSLEKKNRTDITQQADHADIFRYICNTFYKHILKF
jgi:phage terminase large subunit